MQDLLHHVRLRRRGRLFRREIQHHQRLRRHPLRAHRKAPGPGAHEIRGRGEHGLRRRGDEALLHRRDPVQEAVHREQAEPFGRVGPAPGHGHQLRGPGEPVFVPEGHGGLPLRHAGGGRDRGGRRVRRPHGEGGFRLRKAGDLRGPQRQQVDGGHLQAAGHPHPQQPGGPGRAGGAAGGGVLPPRSRTTCAPSA